MLNLLGSTGPRCYRSILLLSSFRIQSPVRNWPASQTYNCQQKHEAFLHTHFSNTCLCTIFPSLSPVFWIYFIWRRLAYVSQFDKALVLVDISHHISTSQLEELVHSVICQQVLRLCQTQWHKRQFSNKGTLRQNGGWWENWQEVYHHPMNHLQHIFLTCGWPTCPLISLCQREASPLSKLRIQILKSLWRRFWHVF